jgi:flagellar basal body-associated protein FliL
MEEEKMKKRVKTVVYGILIAVVFMAASLGAYAPIYFAHHESAYAEACPEQRTLLWCK